MPRNRYKSQTDDDCCSLHTHVVAAVGLELMSLEEEVTLPGSIVGRVRLLVVLVPKETLEAPDPLCQTDTQWNSFEEGCQGEEEEGVASVHDLVLYYSQQLLSS